MEFNQPHQQQISSDVLFIKHRKLFYVLLSASDIINHTVKDALKFNDQVKFKNNTLLIDDNLSVQYYTCSLEDVYDVNVIQNIYFTQSQQSDSISSLQNLLTINQKIFAGEKSNDLIQKTITEQLVLNHVAETLDQNHIDTIQAQQLFSLYDHFLDDQYEEQNNNADILFKDTANKTHNNIGYFDQSEIIVDDQSSLYILNTNYIFKLYLDKTFLSDITNYIYNSVFPKDLFFNACQNGRVYLKVYTLDGKYIKKILLKHSSDTLLKFTDISFSENKMAFRANKSHLLGYNIYHGNSICQTYSCFLGQNYNILNHNANYHILSHNNIQYDYHSLLMHKNSYITIRIEFPCLSYIKFIDLNFTTINPNYNIKIRYGLDSSYLNNMKFLNYVNQINYSNDNKNIQYQGFYCKILDILIEYNGMIDTKLYSVDFKLYNIEKQDIIKTPIFTFNEENTLFLNKQNLISELDSNITTAIQRDSLNNIETVYYTGYGHKAINKYPLWFSGYNNNDYFTFSNIDTANVQHDYLQSLDSNKKSTVWFSLNKNAISGSIDIDRNKFFYFQIEYQLQDKKSQVLFDFRYFTLDGKKKNYPKILCYNFNGIILQFEHSYTDASENKFSEIWTCTNDYYTQSYFQVQYKLANDNNTEQWQHHIIIYINRNNVALVEQDVILTLTTAGSSSNWNFIDSINSNGFQVTGIHNSYNFIRKEYNDYYIKLYTNQKGQNPLVPSKDIGALQIISGNNFYSTNADKRNFKLEFKDGDDKHVKIYSIIFKNYDSTATSSYNQFNRNTIAFDIAGNKLIDFTSETSQNSQNSIINNNFYNTLYCIHYNYSSPYKGTIFDSNQLYFDKSKYDQYNKSNLHITWNKNDGFQYLILFDRFDLSNTQDIEKYSEYFLPFYQYKLLKYPNLQFDYTLQYNERHQYIKMFQYNFDKVEIILSFNIKMKTINKTVKIDYFYSYSNDGYNWSDWLYYYPFKALYAKNIKIKCIVKTDIMDYLDQIKNITIYYVDSDYYYLTNDNYFDTAYMKALEQNKKYMFFMRKLYNDSIYDTTLKLFYIRNFSLLPKIEQLYVDDKLYENSMLKISGYDNICYFQFRLPEHQEQTVNKFNIKIYHIQDTSDSSESSSSLNQDYYELVDDIYISIQQEYNGLFKYQYILSNILNKSVELYAYKVRYFNNDYQVSEYSDYTIFKFNNIPTTPYSLQVHNE